MKASDHRLAGVIEKFNRAKGQFDELIEEMDAFFNQEPKPHFSVGEFDTEAWEWVERFQVREEPPLLFGVILGDCVHNLRSALDHLVCQVTLLDSGGSADCEQTQFPIASKSEDQFEAMADFRIPGLNPEHRAAIKKVQPYRAGDEARRHPLAVLADLSNADKHRLVNPTFSVVASEDIAESVETLVRDIEKSGVSEVRAIYVAKKGERMQHGTPWFRMGWDRKAAPPRNVNVGSDMTLGIAFGEVGLDSRDFKRIAEGVLAIIQYFQAQFPETVFED